MSMIQGGQLTYCQLESAGPMHTEAGLLPAMCTLAKLVYDPQQAAPTWIDLHQIIFSTENHSKNNKNRGKVIINYSPIESWLLLSMWKRTSIVCRRWGLSHSCLLLEIIMKKWNKFKALICWEVIPCSVSILFFNIPGGQKLITTRRGLTQVAVELAASYVYNCTSSAFFTRDCWASDRSTKDEIVRRQFQVCQTSLPLCCRLPHLAIL